MNNQNNNVDNQKLEQQRQQQMMMYQQQQKMMQVQQIMSAMNSISAFKLLETASKYGIKFPIDQNSKWYLSNKLYGLLAENDSENLDQWQSIASAIFTAQQFAQYSMVFNQQQPGMGGMQQPMGMPGMGMNPMMGGMQMPGMNPMGMGMGMPGMNPMMGMGMGMPGMMGGMNPMMGGMPGINPMMNQQTVSSNDFANMDDAEKEKEMTKQKINSFKNYVKSYILYTDPVMLISILMSNGAELDDPETEKILGTALAQSAYFMDNTSLSYFYSIVCGLYNAAISSEAKEGNTSAQQPMMGMMGMGMGMPGMMGGMNPMMGGMPGMNPMGMGMQQPMGMPGMGMNPMMGGMQMPGMGMPMMGGMNPMMGGMQMPGMGNNQTNARSVY